MQMCKTSCASPPAQHPLQVGILHPGQPVGSQSRDVLHLMPPVQYIMTSVVAGSTLRSAAGTAWRPRPSRGVSAKLSCIKQAAGERLWMAGHAVRPSQCGHLDTA